MRGVAAAVVTAIIIGTLYFGREVFVPIALAILLSFVLAPLVELLQRWHIPRGLSVISVVLLAFLSIFALGGVIATQVAELAGDLPRYQFTMREKIKSLRGTAATSGTLELPPTSCRTLAKSSTNQRILQQVRPLHFRLLRRGRRRNPYPSRSDSLLPRPWRTSRR
jgi:predicted PurR-regulated permease PerM